MKKSEAIVIKLLLDLTDRRGFDNQWDETDKEVRKEIKEEWIRIVEETLKG